MSQAERAVYAVAAAIVVLTLAARASASIAVQDMVRLDGYGTDVLLGLGLVVGLDGTGDGGESLPTMRALAKLMEHRGMAVPNLIELSASQSVALVSVTARLPKEGVRKGDVFDAEVSVLSSATSLIGGELLLAPLAGPLPGQGVYAMSSGRIELDGPTPTSGRVRNGVRMIEDVDKPLISANGVLRLQILPRYAGATTASLIESQINQSVLTLTSTAEVARAVDDRTIEVLVSEEYLADPVTFVSEILKIRFDESLLTLSAKVIVNEREGVWTSTGNVTLSPAVVSHENLVVTTVVPPDPPTPENPQITVGTVTSVGEPGDRRREARLEDLRLAMNELAVPIEDQIAILHQLNKVGALHAEFIVE
jgi:flagellar P-ring protein precursor FlgI